ncbi:MAG: hypothetical protein DRJ35_07615, partial [Thermoprotei archaeon]
FVLVDEPSLKDLKNLELAMLKFLRYIGYIPEENPKNLGYRLLMECFLAHPNRAFTVDELLDILSTNRPTLYNYLNKLKGYEVLDELQVEVEGLPEESPGRRTRKAYKLKFEDFRMAFNITLKKAEAVLEVYQQDLEHLSRLLKERY